MTSFNWTPGIGDPTIGGWLTVALYLVASLSCWRLARRLGSADGYWSREYRAWRSISALFLALGLNKQLDLQTAFTEAGRVIAHIQGWYAQRELVQIAFIASTALTCVVAVAILLIWARQAPTSTWAALIGTTLVLGYVMIRAASFHHMDRFIGQRILGLRWNWILEIGGIGLVLLASRWRQLRLTNCTSRLTERQKN